MVFACGGFANRNRFDITNKFTAKQRHQKTTTPCLGLTSLPKSKIMGEG